MPERPTKSAQRMELKVFKIYFYSQLKKSFKLTNYTGVTAPFEVVAPEGGKVTVSEIDLYGDYTVNDASHHSDTVLRFISFDGYNVCHSTILFIIQLAREFNVIYNNNFFRELTYQAIVW